MGRTPNPTIREEILRQAECLIHVHGFASTTLDDIAKRCGMTKANLFHHFGSKEDLGLAVLDWKIADYKARSIVPMCAQGDPIAAVGALFTDAAAFFGGNGCKAGCFVANIALEMADVNEHFRKKTNEFFKAWTASMADCLSRAKAGGLFGETLEPKAAAEAIISLYEGAVLLARTSRDAAVFRRVGKIAQSTLEQHMTRNRRNTTMGPKTPCGC